MRHLQAISVILGLASAAYGQELVTFSFSGRITHGSPGLGVNINDPWCGTYTFDPSSPDSDARITAGKYRSPDTVFAITAGKLHLSFQGTVAGISIYDTPTYDMYIMGASGDSSEGYAVPEFSVALNDPSARALSNALLMPFPPRLADFPSHGLAVNISIGTSMIVIGGTLDTLTPEPGSLLLFVAAFGFCKLRKNVA